MSDAITLRARDNDSQQSTCAYCRELLQNSIYSCPSCQVSLHEDCRRELGRCPTIGCVANESWRASERRIAIEGAIETPALNSNQRTIKLIQLFFVFIPILLWSGLTVLYGIGLILYTFAQMILRGPQAEHLLAIVGCAVGAFVFIPVGLFAWEWIGNLRAALFPSRSQPDSAFSNGERPSKSS